jgi:pyruvate formate lyase activating enzyme
VITRRDLLARAAACTPLAGGWLASHPHVCFGSFPPSNSPDRLQALIRQAPRARYWISAADPGSDCRSCHPPASISGKSPRTGHERAVKCVLCARDCLIPDGQRGWCRARLNVSGELRSLVYGRPVSVHVDPIEKKPFYHFLPGSEAFSLATAGCPLRCRFCQNWEISQARPEDFEGAPSSPDSIAADAAMRQAPVIAFTYNEPTVFAEYLCDIGRAAKKRGLRCVLISCGYMNPEPLREMCEVLAAIKIDLKGFDESFYRSACSAELQPVLRTIRQIARSGVHLEIVNLVVPTLNDSDRMLRGLVEWVAGEIGPDVPIHFTRFHPDYQLLNLQPTPVSTLERAREIALGRGLHYAFVGNVPGHPGNNTYCPGCGKVVIERTGFFLRKLSLDRGKCRYCTRAIAGVWGPT